LDLKHLVKRALRRAPEPGPILRTPQTLSSEERQAILSTVKALEPWFHNMNLADGLWTNPKGSPGPDYPSWRWGIVEPMLGSVEGKSCLDIGCSSGFFSLKLKELGARRVLGIDDGEQVHAIEQANFAAKCLRAEVEFRKAQVQHLAEGEESFDLVLFLGVFYHLRHPLLVLESIRKVCGDRLLMQTITTPHRMSSYEACPELPRRDSGLRTPGLNEPDFPLLRFVEGNLDGDVSCWFVPSPEAVLAMLRSCGFKPETMIFPTKHEMLVSARRV